MNKGNQDESTSDEVSNGYEWICRFHWIEQTMLAQKLE